MSDYLLPEDSQLLDRLVDGELNDDERRELLLRLERTPDGWRRCALAFLEQQAWRSEAKAWTGGVPVNSLRPMPAEVVQRSWSATSRWWPLAMAACVLAAAGTWAVLRNDVGHEVARVPVSTGGSEQMAKLSPTAAAPNMRLVVDGGPNQNDEVVEVPLVDAGQLDQALFGPWSQTVPPEMLQMLEKSGHQVVRERRLMPFDLRDGRRVVVPMDEVEIRPVGNVNRFQ